MQHGTWAERGWLLHDFQTKISLWGRGMTVLAHSYPLGAFYPFTKPSPSCAWSSPPGQLTFLTRLCTRFQQPPGKSLQQLSVGRFFFYCEGYGPLCRVLQPPSLSGRFTVVLWRHGEELIGFVVTSQSCQELTSALVTDEDITVTGLEMAQLAS